LYVRQKNVEKTEPPPFLNVGNFRCNLAPEEAHVVWGGVCVCVCGGGGGAGAGACYCITIKN